jgi:hypothetical protein
MHSQEIHTSSNTSVFSAFFLKLKSRNALLYYFGWSNLIAGLLCILISQLDTNNFVLGINAWIKPAKFYFSSNALSWTMAWYMVYWEKRRAVQKYALRLVLAMSFELMIITWQAANGKLSHFNIQTPLDTILFQLMGVVITYFTLWTLYMAILLFRQTNFPIWMTEGYKWGLRWGLILFVFFAFEGGVMAALLRHTIGAPDGGEGLAFINWSVAYGDLRVAHFFGMHSLQLLPLFGYFFAQARWQIHLLSFIYFLFVCLLLWQAFEGFPLIP